MPKALPGLGEARLAKEQALARPRQLQTVQPEGRLLDREEVRPQWPRRSPRSATVRSAWRR